MYMSNIANIHDVLRRVGLRARGGHVLALVLATAAGCQTGGQTGALAGGGIGALAGQAIGGDTEATLIGAAVGAGIGYVIGNEADKKKAAEMSAATSYRIVGDTLIVNKPGYLINARFRVSGSQLIVNAEEFSAVLERL